MPFKTRRQKESAIGRRVNFIEGGLVTYRKAPARVKGSNEKHYTNPGVSGLRAEESYDYVRAELIKILILAIIIIGFQIALKMLKIGIF